MVTPAGAQAVPIQVDRYVLFEPIAVGGMATVYFARQRGAANFSKAVAIKRMRPDLVHQQEFVNLFLDEARLASRVRHANVVSVIDVIASGDELLLVMEYFHGESLSKLLTTARESKKAVPPAIAVAIICNVLHGLHAAHEAKGDTGEPLGIVHRDVSPQNVIVGVDGVARVADFGIARASGQIHATDEGKTRGKAGYSAPEQLRGGPVTRKIDLFAACALLWEILVGRRLFEGETQAAVITAVLTEPIEPPGLSVPQLPEELDDVIMRGLDRDPKKRPETALALAAALEKAVPPASPTAVAAWVKELAEADLSKREDIVRRIEAGVADIVPAPPAPSSRSSSLPPPMSSAAASPFVSPTSTLPLVDAGDAGTAGSLATTRSPSAAPPMMIEPRSRSLALPLAIALLLLASAGLAATFILPARDSAMSALSARAAEGAATLPSSADPIAEASAPTTSSPPSSPSSSSSPTTPATSVTASTSASSSPPSKASTRPSGWSAPARPKSKRCDPPYDLDPAGRKIFRPECF